MGLFRGAYCWWVTDSEPLNIRETLSALYSEGPLVGGGMMCILTSMGQNQPVVLYSEGTVLFQRFHCILCR